MSHESKAPRQGMMKAFRPGVETRGFRPYASWHEVMVDARAGETLFYHAPMDRFPVRLEKGNGGPYTYEVMARGVRIYPPGSSGRGKQRTSDPFTANAEHLERFRRPTSAGRVLDTTLPAPTAAQRKRMEGPFAKILEQLEERQPPTEQERAEVQRLMSRETGNRAVRLANELTDLDRHWGRPAPVTGYSPENLAKAEHIIRDMANLGASKSSERFDVTRCVHGACVAVSHYTTREEANREAEIDSRSHGNAEVFVEYAGKRIALFKNGRQVK